MTVIHHTCYSFDFLMMMPLYAHIGDIFIYVFSLLFHSSSSSSSFSFFFIKLDKRALIITLFDGRGERGNQFIFQRPYCRLCVFILFIGGKGRREERRERNAFHPFLFSFYKGGIFGEIFKITNHETSFNKNERVD